MRRRGSWPNARCRKVQKTDRHALLGLIYAGLGRCAEPTSEGKRAVDLLPEGADAFDGPILSISRARIKIACGENDFAFQLPERLLAVSCGTTLPELHLGPTWDKPAPTRASSNCWRITTACDNFPLDYVRVVSGTEI